ncbi:MAG: hypothetical protein Q8P51_13780 [Ignavibacteria bacterium]|nr:hypothetical protein [Ignavibacteria bacterium]
MSQIFQSYYSKLELLAEFVADLHLVRTAALCVADSSMTFNSRKGTLCA